MTNTPSSTDEDRGLIDGGVGLRAAAKNIEYARNRACVEGLAGWEHRVVREAADRLESLLSDRAKLEEENAALVHDLERSITTANHYLNENAKLEAEVARLRRCI